LGHLTDTGRGWSPLDIGIFWDLKYMKNQDAKPDGKLTSEQEMLVKQLTEDEVYEIDMALLSNTNDRWHKVAMVVAKTMQKLPCRINGIPDIYYSQRIRNMVDEKQLVARGDLSYMRYSEVRKPVDEHGLSTGLSRHPH
jgi:hypothetical protein